MDFEVEVSSDGIPEPSRGCDALVCTIEREDEVEILVRLRKTGRRLPIVVLVPGANAVLASRAREAGADSVLRKREDPDAMAGLLRTALETIVLAARSAALAAQAKAHSEELRNLIAGRRGIVSIRRTFPVLVVEHDSSAACQIRNALGRSGLTCSHVADSVDGAIDFLEGKDSFGDREKFPAAKLIYVHLHLPQKSGFDLLRWVRSRAQFNQVITIVNSGSDNPEDLRRAYELGANSYVARPSTQRAADELVNAIRMFWVRMNQESR